MNPPPMPPPPPGRRPGNLKIAIRIGILAGVMWAVMQFALTEVMYRLSMMTALPSPAIESLDLLSNAISWPAGSIYEGVELRRMQEIFAVVMEDDGLNAETRARLADFEKSGAIDLEHDDYFEVYDILLGLGHEPDVPLSQEYGIYGGVCVAWGMVIGIMTGGLVWRFYRPTIGPPPLRQ